MNSISTVCLRKGCVAQSEYPSFVTTEPRLYGFVSSLSTEHLTQ